MRMQNSISLSGGSSHPSIQEHRLTVPSNGRHNDDKEDPRGITSDLLHIGDED